MGDRGWSECVPSLRDNNALCLFRVLTNDKLVLGPKNFPVSSGISFHNRIEEIKLSTSDPLLDHCGLTGHLGLTPPAGPLWTDCPPGSDTRPKPILVISQSLMNFELSGPDR